MTTTSQMPPNNQATEYANLLGILLRDIVSDNAGYSVWFNDDGISVRLLLRYLGESSFLLPWHIVTYARDLPSVVRSRVSGHVEQAAVRFYLKDGDNG